MYCTIQIDETLDSRPITVLEFKTENEALAHAENIIKRKGRFYVTVARIVAKGDSLYYMPLQRWPIIIKEEIIQKLNGVL